MPERIATFECTLSASESKQHIPFSFDVPAGTAELHLRLTFSPPLVDEVRNMLTLSLFDPAGWRGAGHRPGDRHEVSIAEDHATQGYRPGPIPPGPWTAVVDTHMVMSGSPCAIRLEVDATTDAAPEGRAQGSPLQRAQASPRGRGWYRGDLHAHSLHSDASW